MDSVIVALVAFVCMAGGALGAMGVASRMPGHYVSKETQDTVKLGVGMIAAMASLILGLMTASVKGGFDATDKDVHSYALNTLSLDTYMRHYGPDACPARGLLRDYAAAVIGETWGKGAGVAPSQPGRDSEEILLALDGMVRHWTPANDDQRMIRASAIERLQTLVASRWTVNEEAVTNIPMVFVVVLVVWLTLIFVSFGLFAQPNLVTIGALVLCALSIAGALFIIIEMSGPFDGLVRVSPKPLVQVMRMLDAHPCSALR